ncbi:MAG: response regulator [Kiritimatiellae bacterium]|nr:response regulator [Kiritimatiellia bacterium]MDD5522479.1 response regulator [Kiritimatiellia bacterium]
MKILIADDETVIGSVFKMVLSCAFKDSSIDVVVNGAEAVDAFRNGNYDVLLMDIHMPVKDGYQACLEIQEICRQENLKMPFVIFCTGYGTSKEIQEITADKTHFALLLKPVTCEKIIDAFKAIK